MKRLIILSGFCFAVPFLKARTSPLRLRRLRRIAPPATPAGAGEPAEDVGAAQTTNHVPMTA